MTWPVFAAFAAVSLACTKDEGRDESVTLTTLPATDVDMTTGTSIGTGGTSGTPTTSSATTDATTSGTTMQVSGSSSGDDSTSMGSSSSDTGVIKLDFEGPPEQTPIPVHDIPGLESITFYETTGMVTEYTFLVGGLELNNSLADPLSMENRDIQGTGVEFYDVFYSNEDGTFNMDGSYLTIAGSFGAKLPAGGGLNLAEISLNYSNDSVEFGSFLASFVGLGDNYAPGTEPNAIDGDLATHTTMGNNVDEPGKRLRVTLGFKSSLMPG